MFHDDSWCFLSVSWQFWMVLKWFWIFIDVSAWNCLGIDGSCWFMMVLFMFFTSPQELETWSKCNQSCLLFCSFVCMHTVPSKEVVWFNSLYLRIRLRIKLRLRMAENGILFISVSSFFFLFLPFSSCFFLFFPFLPVSSVFFTVAFPFYLYSSFLSYIYSKDDQLAGYRDP